MGVQRGRRRIFTSPGSCTTEPRVHDAYVIRDPQYHRSTHIYTYTKVTFHYHENHTPWEPYAKSWCGTSRGLFKLSSEDLYTVVSGLATDSHEVSQLRGDEEGCIDYVITSMGSRDLLDLEDEGMGKLMMLNDFLCLSLLMNLYLLSYQLINGVMLEHTRHIVLSYPLWINTCHKHTLTPTHTSTEPPSQWKS